MKTHQRTDRRAARPRPWLWGTTALLCLSFVSCSALSNALLGPGEESPVDGDQSYLGQGPQTAVDLGQGGEQLLTRFQKVLSEKIELQERETKLLSDLDAQRTKLHDEKTERQKEHRLRVGAEAEAERLRQAKAERETKILHLHMRIAELERTKLQLEIAEVERQIDLLEQEGLGHAAAPLPGR